MTNTREKLVRQIAHARAAAKTLWSAAIDAQLAGKDTTARYRQDLEQAQRADAYLSDLEAVLGDYDRTHPYEMETLGTETMGTETMTETLK